MTGTGVLYESVDVNLLSFNIVQFTRFIKEFPEKLKFSAVMHKCYVNNIMLTTETKACEKALLPYNFLYFVWLPSIFPPYIACFCDIQIVIALNLDIL